MNKLMNVMVLHIFNTDTQSLSSGEEKPQLKFIGIFIIMLSMNNYINLLNRNLEVFYQSSYKLSIQITLKIDFNSIKQWQRTPFKPSVTKARKLVVFLLPFGCLTL